MGDPFAERMMLRRSRKTGVCAWDEGACACTGDRCPRASSKGPGYTEVDVEFEEVDFTPIPLASFTPSVPVEYRTTYSAKFFRKAVRKAICGDEEEEE